MQLLGSMGSTGAGGRGALAMVGMVGDRVEWKKLGEGGIAHKRSYIEVYRGKIGAKIIFCPRNALSFPQIPPPLAARQIWSMLQCCS